ncbi:MAG TPA: roadblock/LC7 domain-containing protein [Polyangiaceae bacterium]|jgi:hypothetical protein|nr:roadblock/LC7 domain-containing protein [Polyangiaceae bacterium]
MNAARQLLRTLCDLDGVIGSFILSDAGGLVATDLPATFDAAAFAEAGPRIVRLAELGGSYGEDTRFFLIRFADYKLFVRVLRGAYLGVLLTPAASMPALRAASGVVGRRAETLLGSEASRGPDTLPAPPRFDVDRTSYPTLTTPSPKLDERPTARPGSALSAPRALTNTLPSITLPEPEVTLPGSASKRAIRYRGRSV